ncbi:MAG: tetratricopeptide repeat protein [Blastocatellia bacterium]|nr:tetratricopeptide repeat protein [Blastocatellia bacterium]
MKGDFKLGHWLIEPRLNSISADGIVNRIEPKVMEVLVCLAEHAGEVVSKEELMQKVWADRFVTDEVLTNSIFELRKALGDKARRPCFIQTIPKRGYRLIAPVSLQTGSSIETEQPALPERRQARASRRWKLAGIGMLAAVLIILAGLKWDALPGLIAGKTKSESIRSIAVLPLKNLSNDESQDYFADGMTEALTSSLARLLPLRVISRSSVMQYKSASKTMPDIGRELNVDAVVEGSVLRTGNRVRITVQLIKTATDRHLWAESYERDSSDIFALHREVSQAIAQEIEINLKLQKEAYRADTRATGPEAYEAYLKGRHLADGMKEEEIREALSYFERAVAADPGYAQAHAGTAGCYISLVEHNYARPDEAYPQAKTSAMSALRLDDSLVEAHTWMGIVKIFYDRDWEGALEEFRRALELNPNYAKGHLWFGEYLWAAGRVEEAIAEIERAQDLDPLSLKTHMTAGDLFYTLQRYDEAAQEYRRALTVDPNHPLAHKGLGHCYFRNSKMSEAEAEYDKFKELSPAPQTVQIPPHLSKWVEREDTRTIIYAFSKVLNQKYVRPTHVARIYLDLGEPDRALYWLEKAYQERDSRLFYLKMDNSWNTLREDSRFIELMRRVGPASL